MPEQETPIAWTALAKGHTVTAADGAQVGTLTEVVADVQKDIFSGVVFRTGLLEDHRFAPAAVVEEITSEAVRLSISAEEADRLEPYGG